MGRYASKGYLNSHIYYSTNVQIAKELKNNTNFGQITEIQEKLDTTCK